MGYILKYVIIGMLPQLNPTQPINQLLNFCERVFQNRDRDQDQDQDRDRDQDRDGMGKMIVAHTNWYIAKTSFIHVI